MVGVVGAQFYHYPSSYQHTQRRIATFRIFCFFLSCAHAARPNYAFVFGFYVVFDILCFPFCMRNQRVEKRLCGRSERSMAFPWADVLFSGCLHCTWFGGGRRGCTGLRRHLNRAGHRGLFDRVCTGAFCALCLSLNLSVCLSVCLVLNYRECPKESSAIKRLY
jgi:hypothetical protein